MKVYVFRFFLDKFETYVVDIVIRLKSRIVKIYLFYVLDNIENRERSKSLAQFATLSQYDDNFPKLDCR